DMDRVRDQFAAAARRGVEAGFDWLALHCAHGYLLSAFLSPLTNHRTHDYGGPAESRLRYPLEVLDALRPVWPADPPVSAPTTAPTSSTSRRGRCRSGSGPSTGGCGRPPSPSASGSRPAWP